MARHFPNWLKGYIEYTKASESPDAYHFWTGVTVIAGALKGRVWIDEFIFKWKPNFYTLLVGPPGVAAKSTTVNLGMRLLRQMDKYHEAPKSCTWQALGKAFIDAMEEFEYVDHNGELHKQRMSALTIAASEVGTFLRTDDPRFIDVLTDLWDGSAPTWDHSTISSSEFTIEHPHINFIGATTPSWLRQNFPDSMIGGGFASRVVFVYREAKRHLVAYPSQVVSSEDFNELEAKLVEDLAQINQMSGQFHLTSDARAWGVAWYKRHWGSERPTDMASDRYGGYWSRKQAHIHKLAMILAAAQSNDLIITERHLQEGEALTETIEKDMRKVFNTIGGVREANHINEILQLVIAHKSLTAKALWGQCYTIMNNQEFKSAMQGCVEGGFLVIAPSSTGPVVKPGPNAYQQVDKLQVPTSES